MAEPFQFKVNPSVASVERHINNGTACLKCSFEYAVIMAFSSCIHVRIPLITMAFGPCIHPFSGSLTFSMPSPSCMSPCASCRLVLHRYPGLVSQGLSRPFPSCWPHPLPCLPSQHLQPYLHSRSLDRIPQHQRSQRLLQFLRQGRFWLEERKDWMLFLVSIASAGGMWTYQCFLERLESGPRLQWGS